MGEPEVIRHVKAEFRDPGYSWKEYTIDVFSNGNITYHLGRQVQYTFDSFMGPEAIKKCRKSSMFGSLKKTFDRVNRYDFIKDGKVVLSLNFGYTGDPMEKNLKQFLSTHFTEISACLSGGRKKRRSRKRKNRRRKTRKNKRRRRKRGGVKESNAPSFHETWSKDFPEQSQKDLQQQQLTHGKTNLVRSMLGLNTKKKKAALVHPIGGRKRKSIRNKKGRGVFSSLRRKKETPKSVDVQMTTVDPRELPRTLKETYNSRDRYASDPNLQMKYPDGLSNSAMSINKLEQQIRETHGDDKLKQIKQEYKESVCSNDHGTYTNYGVIDCTKKGGKRRKSRKAKKSRKRGKSHRRRRR